MQQTKQNSSCELLIVCLWAVCSCQIYQNISIYCWHWIKILVDSLTNDSLQFHGMATSWASILSCPTMLWARLLSKRQIPVERHSMEHVAVPTIGIFYPSTTNWHPTSFSDIFDRLKTQTSSRWYIICSQNIIWGIFKIIDYLFFLSILRICCTHGALMLHLVALVQSKTSVVWRSEYEHLGGRPNMLRDGKHSMEKRWIGQVQKGKFPMKRRGSSQAKLSENNRIF